MKSASSDDDDVGFVEVVDRAWRCAAGDARAARSDRTGASAPAGSRGRIDDINSASDGEVIGPVRKRRPAPPCALLRRERLLRGGEELPPRPDLPAMRDRLGAVGIVEVEDLGLRERVGGAEAGRMIGVSFDLGRTPHVAFDQHGLRVTAVDHRARVEQRTAGTMSSGWRT